MKRRTFAWLTGVSLLAIKAGPADAQASADPSLLKTTLTPMGAERAGNADGSIPAWTGGYTTVPDGWSTGDFMPDFFASEQPVVVVDASNVAQHTDRLSDGIVALINKYGFSIKVYPTHRTAAAPQAVYDNIAVNLTRAKLNSAGGRFGFTGGFGGIPFPIPDTSDPLAAGTQILWNHSARWTGYAFKNDSHGYVVSGGQLTLVARAIDTLDYPYYRKDGTFETYNGLLVRLHAQFTGPASLIGEEVMVWEGSDPHAHGNITWELLPGQGRVRKAPDDAFDTPDNFADGVPIFDDAAQGFNGSLEKYDWKYLGKKEMYIPYNNNGLIAVPAEAAHGEKFINPDFLRFELHRVWVVEATLHPGERNVMSRRMFYVDEDTWMIGLADMFDASNNLYHVSMVPNKTRPEVPGVVNHTEEILYNLQTGSYVTPANAWDEKAHPSIVFYDKLTDSTFDPQNMAASAQY